MSLTRSRPARADRSSQIGRRAFTLPEMMTTMAIFAMVMAAVLASQLYGMRMFQVTSPKLGASDEARAAISSLVGDIRSAKLIRVGTGSLGDFTECPANQLQQGNAIQIYPTLDLSSYVRYYWDISDQKFKRTTNGAVAYDVLASSVSNSLVFTSEDSVGNILTNNQNNRVIGLKLEFYQIQYPKMAVGPGQYYDYYQLHTRVTQRTLM
jgi:prepilin-type N-terminal cleavage/methylation domain-containing protein